MTVVGQPKTLLLYVPLLLLLAVIGAAWTRDPGGHHASSSSSSGGSCTGYEGADRDGSGGQRTRKHHHKARHSHRPDYGHNGGNGNELDNGLAMWINEEQVKMLSGTYAHSRTHTPHTHSLSLTVSRARVPHAQASRPRCMRSSTGR